MISCFTPVMQFFSYVGNYAGCVFFAYFGTYLPGMLDAVRLLTAVCSILTDHRIPGTTSFST